MDRRTFLSRALTLPVLLTARPKSYILFDEGKDTFEKYQKASDTSKKITTTSGNANNFDRFIHDIPVSHIKLHTQDPGKECDKYIASEHKYSDNLTFTNYSETCVISYCSLWSKDEEPLFLIPLSVAVAITTGDDLTLNLDIKPFNLVPVK